MTKKRYITPDTFYSEKIETCEVTPKARYVAPDTQFVPVCGKYDILDTIGPGSSNNPPAEGDAKKHRVGYRLKEDYGVRPKSVWED